MRTDLPVFKRCCFCLPLRHGLISWGYLKLVTSTFFIVVQSLVLEYALTSYEHVSNDGILFYQSLYMFRMIITILLLSIIITDLVLTAVFIVGGHRKNVKLLRIYYAYSFVIWVLFPLFLMMTLGTHIHRWTAAYQLSFYLWKKNIMELTSYCVYFVMQAYFLLLLRSEIKKLNDNSEFRFVNNADQSECEMNCEEDITGEDTADEEDCSSKCKNTCKYKGTCNADQKVICV